MFILCLGAEIAVVFLDLKGALGEIQIRVEYEQESSLTIISKNFLYLYLETISAPTSPRLVLLRTGWSGFHRLYWRLFYLVWRFSKASGLLCTNGGMEVDGPVAICLMY